MKITDLRFRKIFDTEPLKAICSVTLDDSIAIHDVKLVKVNGKYITVMPSRKRSDGTFTDIVHPINTNTRVMLENEIVSAYKALVDGE